MDVEVGTEEADVDAGMDGDVEAGAERASRFSSRTVRKMTVTSTPWTTTAAATAAHTNALGESCTTRLILTVLVSRKVRDEKGRREVEVEGEGEEGADVQTENVERRKVRRREVSVAPPSLALRSAPHHDSVAPATHACPERPSPFSVEE